MLVSHTYQCIDDGSSNLELYDSGTVYPGSGATAASVSGGAVGQDFSSPIYSIQQFFCEFDTSTIDGSISSSGYTPLSATISFYLYPGGGASTAFVLRAYGYTQDGSIAPSDWQTSSTLDVTQVLSSMNTSAMSTGAWNTMSIPAAGPNRLKSWIKTNGTRTGIVFLSDRFLNANIPTGDENILMGWSGADRPKLEVLWSLPAGMAGMNF